jgi:hypothetical protein
MKETTPSTPSTQHEVHVKTTPSPGPAAVLPCSPPSDNASWTKQASVDEVLALTSSVCDYNIRLAAHVETLRARVLELEDENRRLKGLGSGAVQVGVEKMVDTLVADIAELRRELSLLKAAKRSDDAELEAERRKSEMLAELLRAGAME